jgi:hypothetical protein
MEGQWVYSRTDVAILTTPYIPVANKPESVLDNPKFWKICGELCAGGRLAIFILVEVGDVSCRKT